MPKWLVPPLISAAIPLALVPYGEGKNFRFHPKQTWTGLTAREAELSLQELTGGTAVGRGRPRELELCARLICLLPRLLALAGLPIAASCAMPAAVGPTPVETSPVEVQRFSEAVVNSLRSIPSIRVPVTRVFRQGAAWRDFWAGAERHIAGPVQAPQVDFSQGMVLLAAMGAQGSSGYSMRIEGVADAGNELIASVVRTSPDPACGYLTVVTYPADLVRVPRSEKPVRWTFRDELHQC